ncbi:hypothetical protein [Pseudokineococcus sp. 1T1Z-3]|uniref:hypothetical protein n=1 Tax=Pseudokineococcus sp. 1T1Z-3 TaxID=3132745 RepID=UPI003095F399
MAETAAACHLAAAALYAGFQLTVRLVVYPQLGSAGRLLDGAGEEAPAFPALEASHGRRVARLVGPLFLALAGTTSWVLLVALGGRGLASAPGLLAAGAAACTAVVLAVTAAGAVPQHRVLGCGWDAAAHRRLLRWDTVRTAAALLQVALALALALP